MAFETTALYALPMALLGLILWFRVTLMRASLKVSIGDAAHPARYIGNTASLLALLNVMGCLLVTSFGL
jgi:hypothetical protein